MVHSLEIVDFLDATNEPIDGLVPVHDFASVYDPHEIGHLHEAAAFKHIDYVYFRRFKATEGEYVRSSQVAAYVVDNSCNQLSEDQLAKLHHKLWLHGVAPLVYVAWPTRVDILSCAREPDFWDNGTVRYRRAAGIEAQPTDLSPSQSGVETIRTAAAVSEALAARRRFSAYRLAEGTFWDDPHNQILAKDDAAAHRTLIQAIVEADRDLDGAKHPIRRRLLVLMVLIKYLEDRAVIPPGHFGHFHRGAKSFRDILRQGTVEEVLRLLRYFENKFNGDVFTLGDATDRLTTKELRRFAKLVEATELGGQPHFWELFSFEHIPVEVISRLYQRFVTGHGAVYTPPFLAALLLDEVMPYEHMTGKETVLDPACGSGIFLVGAFKRLINYWRSRHDWRKPTADDLKQILAHSIHGVELESGAVDLTAFSLALAVCDALAPPVIWSSLRLERLRGRTLREGDFFDPATFADSADHVWPKKFDVVIGNPPFESRLGSSASAVDTSRPRHQPRVPDKQAAYLFLEQALRILSTHGRACLIQPHGIIYNRNTADFRRYLMQVAPLRAILDFVSMRGLYEGADPKTIAWHAANNTSEQPIAHLTFRRTYSASERIAFEIDHYDWHTVSLADALDNDFVWRVNLLGGGRLHDLSERFRRMRTLGDAIKNKGGWDYGEGFIVGRKGKRVPAPFLTGRPLLPTRAFTAKGIDQRRIDPDKDIVKDTLFKSPYTESRYTPPLILLKAHDSLPVAFWTNAFIAYRAKIIGIHAPASEEDALRAMFEMISRRRRLYQFCCTLHGTQALTGKATVPLKQDIDLLPFPEAPSDLELAFWEDTLKEDVLTHMAEYIRIGQESQLLRTSATTSDLRQYSATYVRMLGSLYRNLKADDPLFLNGLIAQPFYFGARPNVSWLSHDCENSLHGLIYDRTRESLRTARVVRYKDANVILIIKPDRLRYWIRSTAIRDADDTLMDLREQGW
jgi:hypothetical protein